MPSSNTRFSGEVGPTKLCKRRRGKVPDETRKTFKQIMIEPGIRWVLADFTKNAHEMLCCNFKKRCQCFAPHRHDTHYTYHQHRSRGIHRMRKSFSANFSGAGSFSIKVNNDPNKSCNNGATSAFVKIGAPSGFKRRIRSSVTAA